MGVGVDSDNDDNDREEEKERSLRAMMCYVFYSFILDSISLGCSQSRSFSRPSNPRIPQCAIHFSPPAMPFFPTLPLKTVM